MPIYLTLEEVLRLHELQIAEFGGAEGIRDLGLVESALLRPQTGYYADLIEEAAALWESLAMNHGFIDGNKRIAFVTVDVFLQLNGLDIDLPNDAIETFILSNLAAGTFNKSVLDAWLRAHTVPLAE